MSDQPITGAATLAVLEQVHREVFLPGLERIFEEVAARGEVRLRRAELDAAWSSLDFLETVYGFVRGDVLRLEQRLDTIHTELARSARAGLELQLQGCRDRHDDVLAARDRLHGYVASLGKSIERIVDPAQRDALRRHGAGLQRRVDDLGAPLEIADKRLRQYTTALSMFLESLSRTSGDTIAR